MSTYLVPTKHNGVTNSTFNTNVYKPSQTTAINSAKYWLLILRVQTVLQLQEQLNLIQILIFLSHIIYYPILLYHLPHNRVVLLL